MLIFFCVATGAMALIGCLTVIFAEFDRTVQVDGPAAHPVRIAAAVWGLIMIILAPAWGHAPYDDFVGKDTPVQAEACP